MNTSRPGRIAHDLLLPTLLFAALGGMTWAVRGCSGYGAAVGCLFAGVTWGTAWWFIARNPGAHQERRYSSGWIILAVAIGVSLSGNRGWMQWPSFFDGRLQTNTGKGEFLPIPPAYGFLWMFIAGVPWAGIGACLLAWCGDRKPLTLRMWMLRIGCAFGAAFLARWLFNQFPGWFLPLYHELAARYADTQANPNLRRLTNDCREAITHLGFYVGCLGFEALRRDGRNVILILSAGVLNGAGWALLQNWAWAKRFWPDAHFNFWRCWESSGGLSIGLAYGVAYFLANRPDAPPAPTHTAEHGHHRHPNLERFGAYLGLILGLGISIKAGLKGWANIYLGNEAYWNGLLWKIIGPLMCLLFGIIVLQIRKHPKPPGFEGDVFPHAYRLVWLVLITQNILAQLVTGPLSSWNEVAFSLYYLLLFAISAAVVHYYHAVNRPVPLPSPVQR